MTCLSSPIYTGSFSCAVYFKYDKGPDNCLCNLSQSDQLGASLHVLIYALRASKVEIAARSCTLTTPLVQLFFPDKLVTDCGLHAVKSLTQQTSLANKVSISLSSYLQSISDKFHAQLLYIQDRCYIM